MEEASSLDAARATTRQQRSAENFEGTVTYIGGLLDTTAQSGPSPTSGTLDGTVISNSASAAGLGTDDPWNTEDVDIGGSTEKADVGTLRQVLPVSIPSPILKTRSAWDRTSALMDEVVNAVAYRNNAGLRRNRSMGPGEPRLTGGYCGAHANVWRLVLWWRLEAFFLDSSLAHATRSRAPCSDCTTPRPPFDRPPCPLRPLASSLRHV